MKYYSEFIVKISSLIFFHRWHPEVALRYLPIVREINKLGKNIKILEVGSGGLGISPYLGRPVTGVDVEFQKPFHPLLIKVQASSTKLPFDNSSFDVVLSADMLEHMVEKDRKKSVKEMLRVAIKKVCIAVPVGRKAYEQDIELDKYYSSKFGKSYRFLEEQIRLNLPEKKDIYNIISNEAKMLSKKISIRTEGNENLKLRLFLMKGWASNNLITNIIYRKLFLLAIPIVKLFNNEPTYRQIFYIDIKS